MRSKKTIRVLLFLLIFVLTNGLFVALNYVADSVPEEWVKHRITQAIKRHNITTDAYPLFRYGLPSIYSLIGIDQFTDCLIYMHALYRGEDRLKNAIVPGYWDVAGRDHNNLCVSVKRMAFNEVPAEQLVAKHKIRLWQGARTALLFALPKLNFFQINMLIKQITYVAYCLLAFLLFYHHRKTGIAFIPVAVCGIFASGITVYGGVAHSIPYLVCVLTALGLAATPAEYGSRLFPRLWAMTMGCVLAFFYQVDGSLILGFGLVLFCAYFHLYSSMRLSGRWANTFLLLVLFGFGIVGSLLVKQVISFAYFDPAAVWAEFTGQIRYRMYGEHSSQGIASWHALNIQFERYYFAVLNWHAAANFLISTGTWGWIVAAGLSVWAAFRQHSARPVSDLLAFALIGVVVLGRYLIMANHSHIHVIFVSRYLFVLLAFAWAAMIWFAWSCFEAKASRMSKAQ